MEDLFQNGVVVETFTSYNTSYIVSRKEDFLITEYKVLKAKTSAGLIKCSKLLYNGKIKLVYFTNGLKPLSTLWNSMDENSCIRVLTSLFGTVIDLSNNGFLNCHNLVISDNRIFVDINTLSVHLVYLPVCNQNVDKMLFEGDFRARILKMLLSNNNLLPVRMNEVSGILTNGILSLEEVYRQMCVMCKGGMVYNIEQRDAEEIPKREKIPRQQEDRIVIKDVINKKVLERVQLISLDAASPLVLSINKPEFVVGKKVNTVDGVIDFNKAISRVHCKISMQQGEFWITDLGSANGTYVNKVRLIANQPIMIKNGDLIRLANSDFKFKVGGM